MLRSVKTELACLCRRRRIRAVGLAAPAQAQSGEPITIGFGMALTGPLAANGKQALLGMKIWEEEINAKGGLLGRPVKLVLLRRPEQSFDGAGHLHQAARRRQGRSRGQRLRHQHGRAGDAGRDAEEQDVRQPVRARCEPRVQVSDNTSRCCRPARHRRRPSPRASSRSRWRRIRSRRRSRSPPRTRSSPATPAKARARTPRSSI